MMRSPAKSGRNGARRRCHRALLLLLLPLLLTAACGQPNDVRVQLASLARWRPALTEPGRPAPAYFTDTEFVAGDGVRLPLRKWLPQRPVKAVVLALHGFGDYSHAFEMPAARWAADYGIATYAYDQRGFGAAPGHGLWPGEGQLVVDAIVASRILRRAYPGRPLFLLGESMGGGVAILAITGAMRGVTPGPDGLPPVADADGVILSAPAVWGRATMDFLPRAALFAGVRLFPAMVLTGRGLHILASDNLPMLRALGRDPLVMKGARVDTVYGLVDLMDDALAAAPRLLAPVLLMYGANDQIVPRAAISDFAAHLPLSSGAEGGRDRLAYYPHGYHLLLRDLDGAILARDAASWMLDRTAPLPSHADAVETARPWPPPAAPAGSAAAAPAADVAAAMSLASPAAKH